MEPTDFCGTDRFVWNWRICVELTNYGGWKGVTLVSNWRVELTFKIKVLNWRVCGTNRFVWNWRICVKRTDWCGTDGFVLNKRIRVKLTDYGAEKEWTFCGTDVWNWRVHFILSKKVPESSIFFWKFYKSSASVLFSPLSDSELSTISSEKITSVASSR